MNDVVKQIAARATKWCEQHAAGTPVAWEWEMKFAELIVAECVEQISNLMDYTHYDSAADRAIELEALRDARQVVKEHFDLK